MTRFNVSAVVSQVFHLPNQCLHNCFFLTGVGFSYLYNNQPSYGGKTLVFGSYLGQLVSLQCLGMHTVDAEAFWNKASSLTTSKYGLTGAYASMIG